MKQGIEEMELKSNEIIDEQELPFTDIENGDEVYPDT
jgi:hypothetical protein